MGYNVWILDKKSNFELKVEIELNSQKFEIESQYSEIFSQPFGQKTCFVMKSQNSENFSESETKYFLDPYGI